MYAQERQKHEDECAMNIFRSHAKEHSGCFSIDFRAHLDEQINKKRGMKNLEKPLHDWHAYLRKVREEENRAQQKPYQMTSASGIYQSTSNLDNFIGSSSTTSDNKARKVSSSEESVQSIIREITASITLDGSSHHSMPMLLQKDQNRSSAIDTLEPQCENGFERYYRSDDTLFTDVSSSGHSHQKASETELWKSSLRHKIRLNADAEASRLHRQITGETHETVSKVEFSLRYICLSYFKPCGFVNSSWLSN
jgi:hypothetical protein